MSEVSEEGMTSLELLRAIYRNPEVPLPVRMRAAGMALPHEHPRLGVSITTTMDAADFAAQLDHAIERSRKVSAMIDATPVTNVSSENVSSEASDTKPPLSNGGVKPMSIPDRRYRKW